MEVELSDDPLAVNPRSGSAIERFDETLGDLNRDERASSVKVRNDITSETTEVRDQPFFTNGVDDPDSREHVCPYCTYSFTYKQALKRHIAQIHEKHLSKTLQCPKCTYTSVRKDQMRSHYSVVHEDFKPFNCSECNFRAPKAFRVTTHIQKNHGGVGAVIHNTQLKPRPVSPPSEQVAQDLASDDHQTINRLQVQILPKSGSETNTLSPKISDKRVPAILKPAILKRPKHQIEEDIVPFCCPYCDFSSDAQVDMGDHVVLNHMNEHISRNAQAPDPKDCSLCHKKFATTEQLKNHVQAKHPDVLVIQ